MKKINFKLEAFNYIKNVGGKSNIQNIQHCYTRLRFTLKDKSLVNKEELKKNELTKGIVDSNEQYQIILGPGIVDKVFKEVKKILDNDDDTSFNFENLTTKTKKTIGQHLKYATSILGDVFLPIIPLLVCTGLLMGVATLLKQTGVMKANTVFANILSILTDTAFAFLVAFVSWSVVKRLGGTPSMGLLLGLMFISPILPNRSAIAQWEIYLEFIENNGVEQWEAAGLAIPTEVLPWKIGFLEITGFQGSILPALCLGILMCYIEKGMRKIVPTSLTMILVPFITVTTTFIFGLFIFGPLLQLVESGILYLVLGLFKIPWGIGTGIFGFFSQVFVVLGIHQMLTAVEIQMLVEGNLPSATGGAPQGTIYNAIATAGIIAQGGAGFGVALKVKEIKEKNMVIASSIPTLFGITEPVLYGVNVPRTKPLLFGMIGSAVGCFFVGLLNVHCFGMSITVIPGLLLYTYSAIEMLKICLIMLISFSIPAALSIIFYKPRVHIKKEFKLRFGIWLANAGIENKNVKRELKRSINKNLLKQKDIISECTKKIEKHLNLKNEQEIALSKIEKYSNEVDNFETMKQDTLTKKNIDVKINKLNLKISKWKNNLNEIELKLAETSKENDESLKELGILFNNLTTEVVKNNYNNIEELQNELKGIGLKLI